MAWGFPCQDLSGLNVQRLGMAGSRSSLLTEMLRVSNGGKAFFEGRKTKVIGLGENVACMDDAHLEVINAEFLLRPTEVCAGDLSWSLRPRLKW